MLLFDGHEWTSTLAYMFDEAKADFSSFLFPSVETDGNGVYCEVHCRKAFQFILNTQRMQKDGGNTQHLFNS